MRYAEAPLPKRAKTQAHSASSSSARFKDDVNTVVKKVLYRFFSETKLMCVLSFFSKYHMTEFLSNLML